MHTIGASLQKGGGGKVTLCCDGWLVLPLVRKAFSVENRVVVFRGTSLGNGAGGTAQGNWGQESPT